MTSSPRPAPIDARRALRLLRAGAVAGMFLYTSALAADQPLILEAKIPLGEVAGRIDHLAFDPGRNRLYVAELGNDTVGIIDLHDRHVLRTVTGFHEPQGIAYEPSTDVVFVANGGNGIVQIFRGDDFTTLASIDLGDDADNVRIDPTARRVYVGYGDGALAVIDSLTRNRLTDIRLDAHPEGFQLDPAGTSIFVNVPDAGHVALVDRETTRQLATWKTGHLEANFPLAVDRNKGRVIAVFRQPARLQAYDMTSGRSLASADVCGDADDVFLDAKRRRVYVICGTGQVDTLAASGDSFTRIGRLATSPGARTGLYIASLDRLIVAVRSAANEKTALWILRPVP